MKKIYLLSIDGGGVRGKTVTTILANLELDLNTKLFDKFDYFAGTSTGGLIALGIAANQYTGAMLNNLYCNENLNQIFDKTILEELPIHLGSKYSGIGKRQLLNKIFGDKRLFNILKPTLITSYDFNQNKAVIFKSIASTEDTYNPLIAEVADATSAAPTYFPSVLTSEIPPRNLVDGGIAANNPAMCLVIEALRAGYSLDSIFLLSFGTGYNDQINNYNQAENWGSVDWLKHDIIDDLMLGDSTLATYQCSILLGDRYLRIDSPLGLVSSAMDNIDPDNLLALETLGNNLYKETKAELLAFLNQ